MEVEFADKKLEKIEIAKSSIEGFSLDVIKAFQKRMQFIRAADDERDFYAMKSLHFEKLKGNRVGEFSMRLNDQWRLILKIKANKPKNKVLVCGIEDYH